MKRRVFLVTVGGAGVTTMAGCASRSETRDSRPAATAELAHVNGFAPSEPLAFDVAVVAGEWTDRTTDEASHPATVETTVTNDAEETKTVTTGHRRVFATTRSDDGAYSLIDQDRTAEGNVKVADDCWQLEEELVYPAVVRRMELAPGESRSIALDVLTSHDAGDCLPAGTHVFAERYSIQGGDLSMNASFQLTVSKAGTPD